MQKGRWIAAGWLVVAAAWTPASTLVASPAPTAAQFAAAFLFNLMHFATWAAATPALLGLCARWPLRGAAATRHAAALLLAGIFIVPAITLVLPLGEAAMAALAGGANPLSDPRALGQRVLITSLFAVPTYVAVIAIGQTLVWARRAQAREREAAGAELRALRAELNPHFLFNTLGAIGGLAHQAPAQAEAAIATLAQVLRASLADTGATQTLADAVGEIEEHLALYRLLHGPIRFERAVADGLWNRVVPARVLLPLVENAMTHGAAASDGNRWLRLEAAPEGTCGMRIALSNPAPARPAPSHGLGSGLEASRRLLAIHCGPAARLDAALAGDVFTVRLWLPR